MALRFSLTTKPATQKTKLVIAGFELWVEGDAVSVIRIDERYLAQEHSQSKTLAGKESPSVGAAHRRISDMLVKAGAGTCGGNSRWWIFDYLVPQNIMGHRARLDLLSNKAEAMAKEVKRLAPGAEVRALPCGCQARPSWDNWICSSTPLARRISRALAVRPLSAPTPMLSVWIEGPGTAVRADERMRQGACFRCFFLWHSNREANFALYA